MNRRSFILSSLGTLLVPSTKVFSFPSGIVHGQMPTHTGLSFSNWPKRLDEWAYMLMFPGQNPNNYRWAVNGEPFPRPNRLVFPGELVTATPLKLTADPFGTLLEIGD